MRFRQDLGSGPIIFTLTARRERIKWQEEGEERMINTVEPSDAPVCRSRLVLKDRQEKGRSLCRALLQTRRFAASTLLNLDPFPVDREGENNGS